MLLRRGHNRWLVFCAAFFAALFLFAYYGDNGASIRRMTSTSSSPWAADLTATSLSKLQPQHNGDAELEIIVAATKGENVTWLHDYLLDWPKNIYVVDDQSAALTVPENKGREAMVVLTYIIDRYHTLPANMLFHHAQRFQWHNDDPDYDALQLLKRFRVAHLAQHGYVNLRCAWILGCPVEIRPLVDAQNAPENDIPTAKHIYSEAFAELFPDVAVPEAVGVPCCSQFGVTRETVRARPRDDYVRFREWLLASDLDDAISGRVFEYAWHVIFDKEPVHCPHAGECYCKQYGMCDRRDCDNEGCAGQYDLPKYSNLPEGWPMFGWNGEDRHWSGELLWWDTFIQVAPDPTAQSQSRLRCPTSLSLDRITNVYSLRHQNLDSASSISHCGESSELNLKICTMDRPQPASSNLMETHNRLVAAILTHYRTLMMLATVQAEDDQESATPEATAVAGIAMKMEFDGLYSSVKELLTLSRKIKELWVFGALGQQDPSREARGAQIERDVAQAAEMLNGIEETRMRALAEGHGGTWRPLRREDVQALQALAGKQ